MDTQILCSSNVLTGRNREQRKALVALLDPTMDLIFQTLEPYVDLSPLYLFTIEKWTEKEKRLRTFLRAPRDLGLNALDDVPLLKYSDQSHLRQLMTSDI